MFFFVFCLFLYILFEKERTPVLLLLLYTRLLIEINKLMDVGYSSSVTFQQHNTHKLSRASGPDRGLPISPPKKHEAH